MRLLLSLAVAAGATMGAPPAPAQPPLRIAVLGGTGMIGQRIVREALDRGHLVTLLVRDTSRATERQPRLSVAVADALDAAAIERQAAGHDVLVSAVGTARAAAPDYTLYRRVAESLVTALRRLGGRAPRLLVVGGVGSLVDGTGRLLLERAPPERQGEHRGQLAALEYYRTVTDVRWTYLSPPGRIGPGTRTGRYRLGTDTLVVDSTGASQISVEDYAVAMVDEAETARHVGKRFTVAR